jgi:hypothetical protein
LLSYSLFIELILIGINRNEEILCPIGKILHEILNKLNDNSKYIEYWGRNSSVYLEFHRDCDEISFNKNDISKIHAYA